MQEDNSLVEKILSDLENIIYSNDNLNQFDIIPVLENYTNKSPVLYEEHNVGLEMWCVKHVYSYVHSNLLKVRKHLKKIFEADIKKINKLLLGAVLIQPDATVFWNMRRDLIEMNLLNPDKELLLAKLVLSHKSKSNEAFSHRRWIVKRILKNPIANNVTNLEPLVEQELLVAMMASQKVQNNYHAWTHRIWVIENIPDLGLKAVILTNQYSSSLEWVFSNVSEHSGFHYRQRLLIYLKHYLPPTDNYYMVYKNFVRSLEFLLENLLKEMPSSQSTTLYSSFFSVLLYELLYTCNELNKSYPGHESIWYHRRFIVYTILNTIFECFEMNWEHDSKIDNFNLDKNTNIIKSNLCNTTMSATMLENGEKCPKIFKPESKVVESTFLYKFLLKTETDFINENSSSRNNNVIQTDLAKRHENWLRFVLQINCSN